MGYYSQLDAMQREFEAATGRPPTKAETVALALALRLARQAEDILDHENFLAKWEAK